MAFSYKPLWKLLIDRDMTKKQLMQATGISKSTMDKMARGEQVSMDIIDRICSYFDCNVDSIIAVSYTHLDVYKRQSLWRAPQEGRCRKGTVLIMGKTIIVTGGAGFIGANFVYLELQEHPEAVSYTHLLSGLSAFGAGCADALVWCVSHVLTIALLAAVVVVGFILVHRKRKRRMEKHNPTDARS